MNYHLFLSLFISFVSNTLEAQLGLTESIKILLPYEEKNVLEASEVERIFIDFHLDDLTHTIKYDDEGRLIEDFHEKEKKNKYDVKKIYSYPKQQQIEITLNNKFGSWDTTKVKTNFYAKNQLIKQEVTVFKRYRIQQNGQETIKEKKEHQQYLYDYNEFGELLSEIRLKGTKVDTLKGNIYQYDINDKLIKKRYFSRFFGTRYYQNHIYQYDNLGKLTKETITQDSTKIIYYFENEQKIKMEFFTAKNLEFELIFNKNGDATSIKSFKNGELENVVKFKYILDKRGNWKKVVAISALGEEKSVKVFRKIKYRK